MNEIRFDHQVVLVTGSGRGLGAAYARAFATRGARVVVHDAGVEPDGTGGDSAPAESVAAEVGGVAFTDNLESEEACLGFRGRLNTPSRAPGSDEPGARPFRAARTRGGALCSYVGLGRVANWGRESEISDQFGFSPAKT